MVNGTLIDTALETMSRPMAIPSGLRSGFARATILRNDDALFALSCASAGRNLLKIDFFASLGLLDEDSGVDEDVEGAEGVDEVDSGDTGELEGVDCNLVVIEENCRCAGSSRRRRAGSCRDRHGALETCRTSSEAAAGRHRGETTIMLRASIVADVVYAIREYVEGESKRGP